VAKNSGRGDNSDPVIVNQSYLERPKSLLDAVKEIQNMAAMEIPIFGDAAPTLFDQIYALLLVLGFSLGYGFFLATLKSCYIGNISKSMIRNLLGGVVIGAVAKALIDSGSSRRAARNHFRGGTCHYLSVAL
jgi:hypothetical protein